MMDTFIDAWLEGRADLDCIHDWVGRWHACPPFDTYLDRGLSLREYLGFTENEYSEWIHNEKALPSILLARLRDEVRAIKSRFKPF